MGKNASPVLIFILLSACLAFPAIARSQNGTLVITIKNIEPVEGNLVIGIFDKKENFPVDGRQFKKTTLRVTASEMTYKVELPSGKDYGLAIFHDRNTDGVIDKNWLGIPTEPFGFSNHVRPTFSAPSFDQVKFRLDQSRNIEVTLK